MEKLRNKIDERFPWITRFGCEVFKRLPPAKFTIFAGSWLTWMFSILSIAKCRFMSVNDTYLGLFSRPFIDYETGNQLGCIQYSQSDELDSTFVSGRALGTITAVSVSMAMMFITTVLLWCPKDKEILWALSRYSLAIATITQMFTFLVLGSDRCGDAGCSLTGVGILSVFNTMLLAVLSIVIFTEPIPSKPWLTWWRVRNQIPQEVVSPVVSTMSESANTRLARTGYLAPRNKNQSTFPKLEVILEDDSVDPDDESSLSTTSFNLDSIQKSKIFRLATVVMTAIAWSNSIAGISRCTLISLERTDGVLESKFSGLGLYSQTVETAGEFLGCVSYPETAVNEFDGAFRTGRAFGTISAFLVTIIFLLTLYQLFECNCEGLCWRVSMILLPCSVCSHLILFAAFGTNTCEEEKFVECRLGATGVVLVLNIFLLVMLSILFYVVPPPVDPILSLSEEVLSSYRSTTCTAVVTGQPSVKSKTRFCKAILGRDKCPAGDTKKETEINMNEEQLNGTSNNPPESDMVDNITIQVIFTDKEKKTIKTLTHQDGSQTITTTVVELPDEYETESSSEGNLSFDTQDSAL